MLNPSYFLLLCRIVFDLRAEFESFEITGAGGSPVYATAKVNGASYDNDPWYLKKNLYHFPSPLPKDNIRDNMMSVEVGVRYSNLQPKYRPRDWGSIWMSVGDCYKDPKGPGEVFIERERLFLYLLVKPLWKSFSNPSPTLGKVWERFVAFVSNPSPIGEGLGSVSEGFIHKRLAGSRERSWSRSA